MIPTTDVHDALDINYICRCVCASLCLFLIILAGSLTILNLQRCLCCQNRNNNLCDKLGNCFKRVSFSRKNTAGAALVLLSNRDT